MAQNQADVTDEQFRMALSARFIIVEMPGNGNCLFSAFADVYHGSMANQMDSRLALRSYLQTHSDMLGFGNNPGMHEQFARLGEDGVWGGELALIAASNYYNCIIVLEQPGGIIVNYHPLHPGPHPTTIHLSLHNGTHYNLLLPIPPP